MDIVKTVKERLETKIKELGEIKKRAPKKCGETVPNISVSLSIKIEDLEEEIKKLKEILEKMKCKGCGTEENLIKAKDEEGNIVYVCESCYEGVCEGYERIEEDNFYGGCCC